MSGQARAGAGTRRGRCEMNGFTALPRWTLNPVPGVGAHEVRIPDELMVASRRLANDLKVPLSSVLLAAHAKALDALSGDREVWTGYAVEAGSPLPLRLTLGPRSWREALRDIARAESELLAHSDVAVVDLRRGPGLTEPSFETVFELAADRGELPEGIVLRVAFVEHDGRVLRLRYKTD